VAVAGIILAGGASSRMGRPKALLDYRGETFLARLERIIGNHCSPLIVVVGHERDLPVSRGRTVINPAPEQGMLSSLQCGLKALDPIPEGVLFLPVDFPGIEESTVAQVLALFERLPDAAAAMPRQGGKRGHPVLISRRLAELMLALPPEGEARNVIRAHNAEIVYAEVEDAAIHRDIDTPADYQALLERLS
jgi:molybdenum cofactor cytidylyltransferase